MDLINIESGENLPQVLAEMSTEALREELARSLQLNAKQLVHLAAVWRELEKRGEDLSDLRSGMGAYIPMIAADRLDASAVVKFAGQPTLLRALVDLPLDRQREIVDGKLLDVVGMDAGGQPRVAQLPGYSLTAAQVRQVFGPARIRDTREQEAVLLQTVTRKKSSRAAAGSAKRVRFDPASDALVIGRSRVPVAEVLGAIASAEFGDEESDEASEKVVMLKLTESQHRQLRVRSAESGQSMTALAKMALKRADLI